jgi:ribose transport system permease protein
MPADESDTTTMIPAPAGGPSPSPGEASEGVAPGLRAALSLLRLGPVLVLVILVVVMALLSEFFFTERNLLSVGIQASPIALLAIGQYLAILTRGIDLSVGAVAALSSVVGALIFVHGDGPPILVLAAVLGTGIVCGLINGLVYVAFKIPHPFIVTLGTLNIASGIAYLIAGGQAVIGVPKFAQTLGNGKLLGIPYPILLVLVTLAAFLFLLHGMKLGRWIFAVGGNPDAASRAGIPVGRVLITVYTLSGFTAALAALVILGRTGAGDPNYARSLAELQSIAAVIIGGTSFFGGRGNLATVIIGALVLAVIANGLNLLNVNAFWQLVVTGVVLIVAVILDVTRTRVEGRVRTAAGARA